MVGLTLPGREPRPRERLSEPAVQRTVAAQLLRGPTGKGSTWTADLSGPALTPTVTQAMWLGWKQPWKPPWPSEAPATQSTDLGTASRTLASIGATGWEGSTNKHVLIGPHPGLMSRGLEYGRVPCWALAPGQLHASG